MVLSRSFSLFASVLLLALASCAGGSVVEVPFDASLPPLDTRGDALGADLFSQEGLPSPDLFTPPPPDLGVDLGPACQVGTPENCARCGDVCPGADTPTTARLCRASGVCDIECKEESYDVNGDPSDGCEVKDDLPIHDSASDAQKMGHVEDCDNKQTAAAKIPSDDRKHQKAPTDRATGRADFFSLHIADKMFCIVEAEVTIDLSSLPSSATYRVTVDYDCDNNATTSPRVRTIHGGARATLSADTACTTAGDDDGWVLVSVEKISGPHTAASYTVSIEP